MKEMDFETTKIKVYDLNKYFLEITNNKYRSFYWDKMAVITNESGKGVITDYEAIGFQFDNIDEAFEFELENNGPSHQIFANAAKKVKIKDIINNAPYTEMLVKDFFTKRHYNSRCERNWYDMLDYLS